MSEPVSPLDPRLLDALRAERPAPHDARARVRSRLEATIPEMRRGPIGGGGGPSGAGGANGAGGAVRGLGVHTIILAAFLVGGGTGAAFLGSLGGRAQTRVVLVDQGASSVVVTDGAGVAAPRTTTEPTVQTIATEAGASRQPVRAGSLHGSSAAAAHTTKASPPSQLSSERVLLEQARIALVQGDVRTAFEKLALHRKLYPAGLLVEEREAMQVRALVMEGRYAEARRSARSFQARFPSSIFSETVESLIDDMPKDH